MKRQIIKTKPVRPYRVARIIIAVIVVAIIAAVAFELWTREHAAHALQRSSFSSTVRAALAMKDSPTVPSNPPSPVVQ